MITRLVYSSIAVQSVKSNNLHEILEKSRQYNRQANITGVLIYAGNCFLQILEGDKEILDKLMDKISNDTRHYDVELLIVEEDVERHFDLWSMAYLEVYSSNENMTLNDYVEELTSLSGLRHVHEELIIKSCLSIFQNKLSEFSDNSHLITA